MLTFEEKSKIVRRISCAKLYTSINNNDNEYNVVFSDPSLELCSEADFIHTREYNAAVAEGMITLSESFGILIENGDWTRHMESELSSSEAKLVNMLASLNNVGFYKTKEEQIVNDYKVLQDRVLELKSKKYSMWSYTAESFAEGERRKHIIKEITKGDFPPELINSSKFLRDLAVLYFEAGYLGQETIRQLARSYPWRLFWVASKETGTPLFSRPTTEVTPQQYDLLYWSMVYDSAFESTEAPASYVIDNDVLFDAWLKKRSDEREKRENKGVVKDNAGGGNVKLGQHRFIMSDRKGAKDVYKMNDAYGQKIVRDRIKTIQTKGRVADHQMPDCKREIQMEANRMAAARKK